MSDQLKDAAAQVILAALHTAEQTGEWIKGQIPDVLHQLLAWNLTADIVSCVACAMVLGAHVQLLRKFISAYQKARAEYMDARHFDFFYMPLGGLWAIGIGIGGFLSVICCCVLYDNLFDALEILIAPKVWILEYARHLL